MGASARSRDILMSFSPQYGIWCDDVIGVSFPNREDLTEHFGCQVLEVPTLGRHWGYVLYPTRELRRELIRYAIRGSTFQQLMSGIEHMLEEAEAALSTHLHCHYWRDNFVAALLQICVLTCPRERVTRLCEVVRPLMAAPPKTKYEAWIRIVGSCVLPDVVTRKTASEEFLALPGGHYESYPTPTTLKTFACDDHAAFERAIRSGVKRYFSIAEKCKAVGTDAATGKKVIYIDTMHANFPWPWPEAVLAKLYRMRTGFKPKVDSIWWPPALMDQP